MLMRRLISLDEARELFPDKAELKISNNLKQARLELALARLSLATVGSAIDRIERLIKRRVKPARKFNRPAKSGQKRSKNND